MIREQPNEAWVFDALVASCLARIVIPRVLEPSQCNKLARGIGYKAFDDPFVMPVIEAVQDCFEVDLVDPSYVRVECRKEGHGWHSDNGKHMPWCDVSASVLLSDRTQDATGGVLEFADEVPAQNPGDLWVWDTQEDNRHRVSAHNGWRVCLLMFLQGQYGQS